MTNQRAIILLAQMYLPAFNEEEKAALTKAIEALTEQEPRVLTREEVLAHYSLPPTFVDDFGAQEDYRNDIAPLYFDFPHPTEPFIIHWRGYRDVAQHLNEWMPSYGKGWRCWTALPSEEEMKAVPWEEEDNDRDEEDDRK